MPCRYYSEGEEQNIAAKNLNKLTDILCKTCDELEKAGQPIPEAAKIWWDDHKKIDAKRLADEAAHTLALQIKKDQYDEALSRLTKEDRKILGL